MLNMIKIAARNLLRYKRRTLLVSLLIAIGVIFVQVFMAATASYKNIIISQITDAMLGHIQIHKKGYLVSIENVPLNLNLKPHGVEKIEAALKTIPEIDAYSKRLRLGGMISNFTETTNLRLFGIEPEQEYKTAPLLPGRIIEGKSDLEPGQILLPSTLAKGMHLKVGDLIVIIATNKDGSVNGKQFLVGGILDAAPGPGGRDGYIHISDAAELLRMETAEISEIALHLKSFKDIPSVYAQLTQKLGGELNKEGKPAFEIHTWEKLSPFANIAKMLDLMTVFVKVMLVTIVVISILDVMMMSVYERTREIGTIAAIGTLPSRILAMFITEGLLFGISGVVLGNLVSYIIVRIMQSMHITFSFGMREGLVLNPQFDLWSVLWISLIVIVISVIASVQPASKAARLDPIKALKTT